MMDDLTPDNMPTSAPDSQTRLFSARQVSIAAFLGGALAGGWLLARNFSSLGDESQHKAALFGSLLMTVAIAFLVMWLPTDFSNGLFILVIVGVFSAWYHLKQGSAFSTHRENGGAQESWWKTIGISLVAFGATIVIALIAVVAVPLRPVNHVNDGPNIIYYEGDATRQNAESLAEFFRETGVFNDDAYWELTLLFPKHDPRRVIIKLPYAGAIEGTRAHEEIMALTALLDEEKYTIKDVEIHVQNAFGFTTLVVRNE